MPTFYSGLPRQAHEMTVTSRRDPKFSAPEADVLVVHSSDIHVTDGDATPADVRDGMNGLRAILMAARALKAHVAILAGDTFEHNRLAPRTVMRAAQLLAEAGMPVVILPGNHDPTSEDSVLRRGIAGIANVHVLGLADDTVMFPALGLEVWGNPHRDYGDMLPLRHPPPRRGFWRIAVAHGHYEPKPNRATPLRPAWLIGDDEIAAAAADYVALGHWNRAMRVGGDGVEAHYSGSPDFAGTVNLVRLARDGSVAVTREALRWE